MSRQSGDSNALRPYTGRQRQGGCRPQAAACGTAAAEKNPRGRAESAEAAALSAPPSGRESAPHSSPSPGPAARRPRSRAPAGRRRRLARSNAGLVRIADPARVRPARAAGLRGGIRRPHCKLPGYSANEFSEGAPSRPPGEVQAECPGPGRAGLTQARQGPRAPPGPRRMGFNRPMAHEARNAGAEGAAPRACGRTRGGSPDSRGPLGADSEASSRTS